jgi:hypothetical protein
MKDTLPAPRIEVFVSSMEYATLTYHSKILKYQHEVFRLTSDTLGRTIACDKFFPDKDKEALTLVAGLEGKGVYEIKIYDLSEKLSVRLSALIRGILQTPAVFVNGKRLKRITEDEMESALHNRPN